MDLVEQDFKSLQAEFKKKSPQIREVSFARANSFRVSKLL